MAGEVVAESLAPRQAAARPAIRNARRVVVVAGALGAAAQLLFFDVGLGINLPIAIGLLLVAAWRLRQSRRLDRLDVWLAPAALAFAAFAALRADATLVALDVLTSVTLAGAAVATFSGRSVVPRPLATVIGLAATTIGWIFAGAVHATSSALRGIEPRTVLGRRGPHVMPVLRGIAIAVPIVIVFVAFFSAADAVFAGLVDDLFGFRIDLGDLGWRVAVALVFAWFAAGSLALSASAASAPSDDKTSRANGWHVGITEILVVVVAVDIVFGIFVGLQAAYLFGGLDTLSAAGISYSAYARRGFFELVAVSVMAGALISAADRLAPRRTMPVVVAAIALAALSAVVLASAALRLRLYQEAYGWTELRLYVVATIAVLAITLLALVVALATDRVRWVGHVVIVTVLVVGAALNLIGPVRFITEQNVARALDPALVPEHGVSGLDETYLAALDDDAIPPLIEAMPGFGANDAGFLREALAWRLQELRNEPGLSAWQAWNAGRASARDALEAAEARGDLP